eukprot:TRINITY_DN2663_c0_g1_i1.p1 TRINITY_DN2663_c0_g1~~TRINITY_DN2663_c0_g1_i1.p1  ORF type:complete len:137 (-),score=41.48 TRINITY_DN2663_c0_g1_i1:10-396(-)
MALKGKEKQDIDVTWEDQQMINTFGRLNLRLHDIRAENSKIEEQKQDLEDAENELILDEGIEPVKYKMGEVFIEMSAERATKIIEGEQKLLSERLEQNNAEVEQINKILNEHKVKLYGKFGQAINLDE